MGTQALVGSQILNAQIRPKELVAYRVNTCLSPRIKRLRTIIRSLGGISIVLSVLSPPLDSQHHTLLAQHMLNRGRIQFKVRRLYSHQALRRGQIQRTTSGMNTILRIRNRTFLLIKIISIRGTSPFNNSPRLNPSPNPQKTSSHLLLITPCQRQSPMLPRHQFPRTPKRTPSYRPSLKLSAGKSNQPTPPTSPPSPNSMRSKPPCNPR